MEQYDLLVTLSLVTLVLVVIFSVWQVYGTKRSQRRGHRSIAAIERGAKHKHERPNTVHPGTETDERPRVT